MTTFRTLINVYRVELFVACIALALALFSYFGSSLRFANDDQFILYRYIEHIAAGHGFVFNLGERVLGSTTPLFTLLAATSKWLLPWADTQSLIASLNAFLLAGSVAVFYRVALRFVGQSYALFAVAVFILNLARTIPEGMETPLFILTLFLFLERYLAEKYGQSAVFLALMVLTRPDAGLIAVLAFIAWWSRKGFYSAVRLGALSGAVALPWLFFSIAYFGSALPQSLAAKLGSGDIYNIPTFEAMKVQFAHLSRIFLGRVYDPSNLVLQTLVNLLPFLALALLGARRMVSSGRWLVPAIPVAYFVSFSLANPVMFPWYLSQMEPLWILLATGGIAVLMNRVTSQKIRVLLLAILLLGPVVSYAGLFVRNEGGKIPYRDAGEYLRDHAQPHDIVGLSDIGIVSYISGLPVVDFIGLVSPDSVGYYPVSDECATGAIYIIPPELIRTYKPSWVVASDEQLGPCVLSDPLFVENYTLQLRSGAIGVFERER